MEHRRQQVGMGEIKIGTGSDILHAILGSCVGIGFIWKNGNRCGLAHCLLPEAPTQICSIGARYVSQAVPSLLMMMGIKEHDYPDIEVILAGGARMLKVGSRGFQVGPLNVAAAKKYLLKSGLKITYDDLGGRTGRQILIDCEQKKFLVTGLARQNEGILHGNT